MNLPGGKKRLIALICISLLTVLLLVGRLYNMQVTNAAQYLAQTGRTIVRTTEVESIRGEIFDRYGRPLVQNSTGYNLEVDKVSLGEGDLNTLLLESVHLLDMRGEAYADNLPVSQAPYSYTIEVEAAGTMARRLRSTLDTLSLPVEATADELMEALFERYKIDSETLSAYEARAVAALRYEMEHMDYAISNPFLLASDVSIETVTRVAERRDLYQGLEMVAVAQRDYVDGTLAPHLLGWVGALSPEAYEARKDQGYAMDDEIGRDGVELAFEDYLRGEDGIRTIEQNILGTIVGVTDNVPAQPGDNIVLTLDSELQRVAQQSLEETIKSISDRGLLYNREGYDADAGAVVVMDVNNGEVLAAASYPGYDLSLFNEQYSLLAQDPALPTLNRAFAGVYEPGSTFKMLTAAAGLQAGVIDETTRITCTGRYEHFAPEYRPACWIFNDYGVTHGVQDVRAALENSCNIFFFETSRLLGIDRLNDYARLFGLGEEATLLKSVHDYITGEETVAVSPTVAVETGMDEAVHRAVVEGMLQVTEDGTASSVFASYAIPVAGKTGSAEVPGGSAHGVFTAFAPVDDPQIAIAIVVEHGAHGNSVAGVARDILEAYFATEQDQTAPVLPGSLIY